MNTKNTPGPLQIAFDDSIKMWVVFYTTDRVDYDFETGQPLSPVMCDYHVVAQYKTLDMAIKKSTE